MAILVSILFILLFPFIFYKIISPLIFRLIGLSVNNSIKNTILIISFGAMAATMTAVPILIIKYFPKTNEQIRQKKYSKSINDAIENQRKGFYDLAYSNYDSAEKYSNKNLSFLFEKSVLKYQNGDSKRAIEIINKLIHSHEEKNIFDAQSYEYRSMYYFSIYDYKNSIYDLEKALKLDSLYNTEWSTQLSVLYLLINNIDSSFLHMINAEKSISSQNEDDKEEHLRELNLLKALIYFKKNDKLSACSYFKQYQYQKRTEIYFNYSENLLDRRFEDYETMYSNLFKVEFTKLSSLCHNE